MKKEPKPRLTTRGKGKTLVFLKNALENYDNKCIEWPFYVMKEGYGQAATHEGSVLAHRLMCEMAHGPCPEGRTQAAHICGNKKCVNPSHLRWASQSENESDKLTHGTWYSRISNGKWTEEQIREIRQMHSIGKSMEEISVTTGIPKSTVSKIAYRITWKHIE